MSKSSTVFEIYRSYDPVIKQHVAPRDAGQYAVRRDASILYEAGLPEDAKPILFVCRALTRPQREGLETIGAPKTRYRMAFALSLVEIRNLVDESGRPCTPSTWKPPREPGQALDDDAFDALEELGFSDADVWDIGSAVEELSTVGKGMQPSCPQLDSSRRAWFSPSSSRPAEPKTVDETPSDR